MANVTVTIQFGVLLQYDPSRFVRPGDTVTFRLADSTDSATVFFDPFNPIQLNSTQTSAWRQVSNTAPSGTYSFNVEVNGPTQDLGESGSVVSPGKVSPGKVSPGNKETKTGELDVTTDPPKK
jgi:hypothetical protein